MPLDCNNINHTMKTLKIALVILLFAAAPVFSYAQENTLLKPVVEIVEIEVSNSDIEISIFDMQEGDQHNYFLDLGTLGIGDAFLQLHLDPLSHLFIFLGNTLAEAQDAMDDLKAFAKQPHATTREMMGTLSVGNPLTGTPEPLYLTVRKGLFSSNVEFSIHRESAVRSTWIAKSDIGSLASSLKIYRKLHKKQP